MSENFQKVADYVMSDDDSELAKTKAELAYALHALEREIAIAQSQQSRCETLIRVMRSIARGLNGKPLRGIDAEDRARVTLNGLGIDWRKSEA